MKSRSLSMVGCTLLSGCLLICALGADAKQIWWSLRPLDAAQPPQSMNKAWPKNAIDHFILANLEKHGLTPNPSASKRTLLRRVYIDLTGLPPTPDELLTFEKDSSAEAYDKIVDRLLASPRYGERMARRWMDLVHFAESHGHDEDKPRPHAWPYRDYLIRSFNADKPFTRFIEEQIAGDVLYPDQADGVVALGLLAAGPWDQSSQMGIMDGTLDKQIARYLDRDDIVTTVMSTFTSMTVHCARCHDHKFDPISMDDYYSLQAVFAGVERVNRTYDTDPQLARKRKTLQAERKAFEKREPADPFWLQEEQQRLVASWEKSQTNWQFVQPVKLQSSGSATLEELPDHSIRSGGKRPEVDTITITVEPTIERITAIRLELLTDPALPHQGPGRQDNGNLHLNEIRLSAAPLLDPSAESEIKLNKATSDFDQLGWTAAMAIDGKPKTAWGIYPQVGKPHIAIFAFDQPLEAADLHQLKIVLEQTHGGGHLIGRFRISLTDAEILETAQLRSKELTEALATSSGRRTDSHRKQLARQARLALCDKELKMLPAPQTVYAIANDFPADGNFKPPTGPRPVHLLRRGDIKQPGREAKPGALTCVSSLPARFHVTDTIDEARRRIALTKWLTHRDNALVWRSLANRLWLWHFGEGIVSTPNDFGKMGGQPIHPQLLDWLAGRLRDGVSLKSMQKMMVTSATYRQSSTRNPQAATLDPSNRWLARMNRTRLDAETTRDAILQAAGKLDLTMYGPSVQHFKQKPGLHVTPIVEYDQFDVDSPASYRRSVYRFIFRTLPDPLLDVMDCPDASQLTPKRNESVTALQALTLLNHPFMTRMSVHLALRVQKEHKTLEDQVHRLVQLVLLRDPSAQEAKKLQDYAAQHGLTNLARVLLNANEFHFID